MPAIIQRENNLAPSQVNEQFMSILDLFPSLISAAGIEGPSMPKTDDQNRWNEILDSSKESPAEFIINFDEEYAYINPPWRLRYEIDGSITCLSQRENSAGHLQ